jgi:hypothetical protein
MLKGIEVKTHDIGKLSRELRVGADLEGAR